MKLENSRILICNDDGVHSVGIGKLIAISRKIAREVWVGAPDSERSATSHSLTLRSPLKIDKIDEKTFSVDGTPTDCIKLAINKIMKNNPPDLLLSGINRGGNLACDIAYSGTVAAAVEGTLLGIPSIALSQVIFDNDDHRKDDWSSAENYTEHVIKQIINISRPSDVLINVNFPPVPSINVSGLAVGYQDKLEFSDEIIENYDAQGNSYYRIGRQRRSENYTHGSDIDLIQKGKISITPLTVNLTHKEMEKILKKLLAEEA